MEMILAKGMRAGKNSYSLSSSKSSSHPSSKSSSKSSSGSSSSSDIQHSARSAPQLLSPSHKHFLPPLHFPVRKNTSQIHTFPGASTTVRSLNCSSDFSAVGAEVLAGKIVIFPTDTVFGI